MQQYSYQLEKQQGRLKRMEGNLCQFIKSFRKLLLNKGIIEVLLFLEVYRFVS